MTLLTRYIARVTLRSILMAFVIVTSIIMLVDFVENSRNLDVGTEISNLTILYLTALKTPQLVEQTIPFIILFGVMGALYGLNRRSELIVLRASGLSAWRFLIPVIGVAALIGIVWSLLINPLAARSMDYHEDLIARMGDPSAAAQSESEIWLREGTEFEQTVIYSPRLDILNRTLYDVEITLFEADETGDLVFTRRFDAESAELLPTSYWQLNNVVENTADAEQEINQAVSWPTTITVADLQQRSGQSSAPPFWKLPAEINALARAGFSNTALRMQFHKLLALPLTLIAMSIIAAGVSMHLTREGGTFRLMLSGALVGFGVFFVENIIKAFGETGAVNVMFSVWVIPLLVLLLGLNYLSRIEDG